jgi:Tfp pilus assembly protein PilZ
MTATTETAGERRIFERFSARFPVKFKDSNEDYGAKVSLRDASAEGLRVLTKERYFLDDQLDLEVELPDGGEPLVLSGHVVWAKLLNLSSWDIGIQLSQVNFLKMHRLYKLTESYTL